MLVLRENIFYVKIELFTVFNTIYQCLAIVYFASTPQ